MPYIEKIKQHAITVEFICVYCQRHTKAEMVAFESRISDLLVTNWGWARIKLEFFPVCDECMGTVPFQLRELK